MGTCRQRGAASVEFALVFPIFFSVFYAIVCYGFVFTIQQSLSMAVAEGARAALRDASSDAQRITNAQNASNQVLSWLASGSYDATATVAACVGDPSVNCVQVTASYDYAGYPVVPPLPLLGVAVPNTLNATATVQL
jgi:Flp pilus assembly protein TadG